jgi:uncharacterized protein YraI
MLTNMNRTLLILLTILILVLTACNGTRDGEQPTATEEPLQTEELPEPTATVEQVPTTTSEPATPTSIPTTIPTPITSDPAALLGPPDLNDDFSNASNFQDTTTPCFESEIRDGKLFMNAVGEQGSFCWQIAGFSPIANSYMEVVGENLACEGSNRFGLFLRAPENDRGYMYGITCDGRYAMSYWDGTSTTELVAPTPNQAIQAGQSAINRIGILATGPIFDFYVNGIYLDRVVDDTFIEPGKMGFFVQNSSEQGFFVTYDDLKIWLLDGDEQQLETTEQASTGAPPPAEGEPTVVANTNVNIRSGPSTQYPVVGALLTGESAKVVGISPDSTWWAIEIPPGQTTDNVGWVSGDFVTASNTVGVPVIQPPDLPADITPAPPDGEGNQFVTTDVINVREGPGNEYDSIGKLPAGTEVTVTGQSDDGNWASINLPAGGIGWVNTGYLTPVGGDS